MLVRGNTLAAPTARQQFCCDGSMPATLRCSRRILRTKRHSPTSCFTNPGDDVQVVYFPCGPSLVSFLVPNEDGRDVETILVGREGAVGGIVSLGYLPAYTASMVKFGGPFVRLHVGKLDAAKATSASLRNVFARYADCMLAQMFQSTPAMRSIRIEQRTAKWIIFGDGAHRWRQRRAAHHEQLATLLGSAAAMPAA